MKNNRKVVKGRVGDRVGYIRRDSSTFFGSVICSSGIGTISRIELDKMFPTRYYINTPQKTIICCDSEITKIV